MSKITKNVKNHQKCQKSRKITKNETRITKITQDQKSPKMSKMRSHNVRFVTLVAGILFPVKLRLVFSKNDHRFERSKIAKMAPISPYIWPKNLKPKTSILKPKTSILKPKTSKITKNGHFGQKSPKLAKSTKISKTGQNWIF